MVDTFTYPRIVIAAPHGKSGKTVLTLGLLRLLQRLGHVVQPYKKGPDFIDLGWHSVACKRGSRNLDGFFMSPAQMRGVLRKHSADADISVIEGAMGIYDGLDTSGSCSTAEVSKIIKAPVVLVVDVTRMTRTTAALVMGCQHFDSDVKIAAVILNRVRGPRQEQLVRTTIEENCQIPVIGAIPTEASMVIPDRHLGLMSSTEAASIEAVLDGIADIVDKHVDIEALMRLASTAEAMDSDIIDINDPMNMLWGAEKHLQEPHKVRIAVIKDQVFSFYYRENLEALEALGAELIYLNSLEDVRVPHGVDGLYIGGGFPEMFAERLEANQTFLASIRASAERGMPIYAECGGLMLLARRLDLAGKSYKFSGALAMDVEMCEKRQGHGYSVLRSDSANPWYAAGTTVKGHEFHHSRVMNISPKLQVACKNERGSGLGKKRDGIVYRSVFASYTHVNCFATPSWARAFVANALHHKGFRAKFRRKFNPHSAHKAQAAS